MDVTYGRNFHLGAPDTRQHERTFTSRDVHYFLEVPFMLRLKIWTGNERLNCRFKHCKKGDLRDVILREQCNFNLLHGDSCCKLAV